MRGWLEWEMVGEAVPEGDVETLPCSWMALPRSKLSVRAKQVIPVQLSPVFLPAKRDR